MKDNETEHLEGISNLLDIAIDLTATRRSLDGAYSAYKKAREASKDELGDQAIMTAVACAYLAAWFDSCEERNLLDDKHELRLFRKHVQAFLVAAKSKQP